MKVFCVVGNIKSGKTTYCEKHFPHEGYVRVHFGRVIRSMVGMGPAASEANPNQWALTDGLVETLLDAGIGLAQRLGKNLVLDGYPRGVSQAEQLVRRVEDGDELHVFRLVVPERMCIARMGPDTSIGEMTRLERSVLDVEKVCTFLKEKGVVISCVDNY